MIVNLRAVILMPRNVTNFTELLRERLIEILDARKTDLLEDTNLKYKSQKKT
jgi:hypothetical protein